MIKVTILRFMLACILVLATGGIASGICDPGDGNDTEADAQRIGYDESITGYVCPEDVFDFYYLVIPEGADASGSIAFTSPVASTVLRIWHVDTGVRLIDDVFTTDTRDEIVVEIPSGSLPSGTYYARVFFWSAAAFDHEYTLSIDLEGPGLTSCIEDGNNDFDTAQDLEFDTEVSDWVCPEDIFDYYLFTVTDPGWHPHGDITLTTSGGEATLLLFGAHEGQLFNESSVDGSVEFDFTDNGENGLEHENYYAIVKFPEDWTGEISYTLSLQKERPPITLPDMGIYREFEFPEPEEEVGASGLFEFPIITAYVLDVPEEIWEAPWPSTRGDRHNTGRSTFEGPNVGYREFMVSWEYDFGLSVGDMTEDHKSYSGLLTGPDGMMYVLEKPSLDIKVFSTVRDSLLGTIDTGSFRPPCLDKNGDLYYIAPDGRLTKYAREAEFPPQRVPGEGGKVVELVTDRIYTACIGDDSTTVQAWWPGDATRLWSIGPLDGQLVGITENRSMMGLYVQTGKALYYIDRDGEIDRTWRFPVHRGRPPYLVGPLKPIMASDGTVWVYDMCTMMSYVFRWDNPAALDQYEFDVRPQAACLDSRDRLFVTTQGRTRCFEDWTTVVWDYSYSQDHETSGWVYYVGDLIMDVDNIMWHVHYRHDYNVDRPDQERYTSMWWFINTSDGHNRRTGLSLRLDEDIIRLMIEEKPLGGGAEMAIGSNEELIILTLSGQLKVYARNPSPG